MGNDMSGEGIELTDAQGILEAWSVALLPGPDRRPMPPAGPRQSARTTIRVRSEQRLLV